MKRIVFPGSSIIIGIVIFLCVFITSIAEAQYASSFESLSASSSGTILTGQDGYYLPSGTDWMAYTYAGNTLGLSSNPDGGSQFVAGNATSSYLARAQHDIDLSSSSVWTFSYDFATGYTGTPPASDNIGSFSTTPSGGTGATFVQVMAWDNLNNPADGFSIGYYGYSTGVLSYLGDAWSGLAYNHWYRTWTTVDFTTSTIIEIGIMDLSASIISFGNPNWFLYGSSLPTGFRFFAGGGSDGYPYAGNVLAFDNINISSVPEPATLLLLGIGLIGLAGLRRKV